MGKESNPVEESVLDSDQLNSEENAPSTERIVSDSDNAEISSENMNLNENDDKKLSDGELSDDAREISSGLTEGSEKHGIFYTKPLKLSFQVYRLHFTNIPVLKSIQLAFYEKYCVLLLQNGIVAGDTIELVEKLSELLNIKTECVEEFVEDLDRRNVLVYDRSTRLFFMDPTVHYTMDKTRNNAMFAELETKMADCDKIVCINEIQEFHLEKDFPETVFRRVGTESAMSIQSVPEQIRVSAQNDSKQLKMLFVRCFEETNLHLSKDFSYILDPDKCVSYSVEFDAIAEYEYDSSARMSKRIGVIVSKDNFLPETFINMLASKWDTDQKLPRFIELNENFYRQIDPHIASMDQIDTQIETARDSIAPIEETLQADKTKLTELKKAHKKVKKAEDDSVATIQKQLDLTDDEIKVNQTLVDSKETDAELIKSLKATIKELKENHGKLSRELEEKQLSIEALTKEHKTAEAELASQISEREEELKKANDTVRAYEEKQKETTTSFNLLLSQNAKQLSPVVQNVVKKYPAGSNIFFRYVSDISICLDSAVSASESNAFDEMGRCIDAIREMYRKTLQAVFDVTLQKNVQNLGSYLTDGFNLIAIENMFKQRKIPLDIRSKLVAFHALANAIGHSLENGPRKKDNDKRVANFKKLGKVEREKILLAVPNFFNSLNCTKNEVADINKKLKV